MVSVILLSGGLGTRFGSEIPKQYIKLNKKEIALYSYECFLSIDEVTQVVVVCQKEYHSLFQRYTTEKKICFAEPGLRREDSVYNGFVKLDNDESLVCIHDAARPFINKELVVRALNAASDYGAAAVGMPLKFTIKQVSSQAFVLNTPDRSTFFEIQTPQVLKYPILKESFEFLKENKLSVTDDVSLAELLGYPVKIVEGDYNNIKITTSHDLLIANQLIHTFFNNQREACFV